MLEHIITAELIAVQEEHGQTDEVAELFGQFACKKQKGGMSAKHMYAGKYNSPPIELPATLK